LREPPRLYANIDTRTQDVAKSMWPDLIALDDAELETDAREISTLMVLGRTIGRGMLKAQARQR
jgi:hypothetical protein